MTVQNHYFPIENKQILTQDIFNFTRIHAGGSLDANDSYQRLKLEEENFEKIKNEYSSSSNSFNKWKNWFLSKSKSSVNSIERGLSKADYINFLKEQNSKVSLEMALLLDSSDSETLRLYSQTLLQRSEAIGVDDQDKATLLDRAKWYLEKSAK